MAEHDFDETLRDFDVNEDYSARIAQAFGNIPRRVQPAAAPRSSIRRVGDVTVIPEINQQYLADPTAAVIANVPLFDRPEDIEIWNADNRIQRMVEHQDAAAERADVLSKNRRDQFSRLVLDFVSEGIGSDVNNLVGRADDSLPRLRVTTIPPAQVAFNARNDGTAPAFGLPTSFPVQPLSTAPLTAEQMQFQADQQLIRDRAEQEFAYERQVSNALQQVGVSGVFKLSASVQNGVNRALADLRSKNPRKFTNAKLDQFIETDDVMDFMVNLTGLHIVLQYVINAKRYYHDRDSKRRKREIVQLVNDMDRDLKLDGDYFVVMSGEEIEEGKINASKSIRRAKTGRK